MPKTPQTVQPLARLLIAMAAVLLLGVPPSFAQAPECEAPEELINKPVQEVEPGAFRIVVDGRLLEATESTEFFTAEGRETDLSYFVPGMIVTAEYCPADSNGERPGESEEPGDSGEEGGREGGESAGQQEGSPRPGGVLLSLKEAIGPIGPPEGRAEGILVELLPNELAFVLETENGEEVLILTDSGTRFYVRNEREANFSDLAEGQLVVAEGTAAAMEDEFALVAEVVVIKEETTAPPPPDIELDGTVTDIDTGNKLFVVDQEFLFAVDNTTQFQVADTTFNAEFDSFSDLREGDVVFVQGVAIEDGDREDENEDGDREEENEDGDREEENEDGDRGDENEDGDRGDGELKQDGTTTLFLAKNVTLLEREPNFNIEVRGAILEIDDEKRSFILETYPEEEKENNPPFVPIYSVEVSEDTIIRANGAELDFEDLAVGQRVQVEGEQSLLTIFPPILLAEEIEVLSNDPIGEPIEFEAVVEEVLEQTRELMVRTNSTGDATDAPEYRVAARNNTQILDVNGNEIPFREIAEGDLIFVDGKVSPMEIYPPLVNAELIQKLEGNTPLPVLLRGELAEIDLENDEIVIAETPDTRSSIRVTENTVVRSRFTDETLTLADLEIGDYLQVAALPSGSENILTAIEIIIEEDLNQPIEIEGVVSEIRNERSFTLRADEVNSGEPNGGIFDVFVSDDTVQEDTNGNAIDFEDLSENSRVFVEGEVSPLTIFPPQVNAELIVLLGEEPREPFEIRGVVESVDLTSGTLDVITNSANAPRTITVINETVIFDAEENEIELAGIAEGDRIEALVLELDFAEKDRPESAPQLIAIEIRILPEEPNEPFEIRGMITDIDVDRSFIEIRSANSEREEAVVVTANTVIREESGDLIDLVALRSGDIVEALVFEEISRPPFPGDDDGEEDDDRDEDGDRDESEEDDREGGEEVNRQQEQEGDLGGDESNNGDNREEGDRDGTDRPETRTLIAIEIVRIDSGPVDDIQIAGPVEDIFPEQKRFQLAGFPVDVTPETEIKTANGVLADFEAIQIGAFVDVDGILIENNATNAPLIIAEEVIIITDPSLITVEGEVAAITVDSSADDAFIELTDGFGGRIAEDVQVQNQFGGELELSDVKVGDLVRLVAENTTAIPVVIEITVLRNQPPEVLLTGLIDSVDYDEQVFVLQGQLVTVDDETEIIGINNQDLAFTDLAPGQFAEVRGVLHSEGEVLAKDIRLLDDPITGGRVDFRGLIAEVDLSAGTLSVSGRLVFTDDNTVFLDIDNRLVTLADLQAGMRVEVEGETLPLDPGTAGPRPVQATKVEVEGNGCLEETLTGEIAAIEDGVWVIGEVEVLINSATMFIGTDGSPALPTDFAVGQLVIAEGCAAPGEALSTRVIRSADSITPPVCEIVELFEGRVESVNTENGIVQVNEDRVAVNAETEILREGVGMVPIDEIQVGDRARVMTTDETVDDLRLACKIILRGGVPPEPPSQNRVLGRIAEINDAELMLTVRQRLIQVENDTLIETRNGEQLSFSDLEEGHFIDARGRLDAENVLVAGRIRVQEENIVPGPPPVIAGRLTSVDLPSIFVGEQEIALTDETEILSFDNETIPAEELQVDDFVRVKIDRDAVTPAVEPPVYVAERVKIQAAPIEAIDLEGQTITAAGLTVSVVIPDNSAGAGDATKFIEIGGGEPNAIELTDLNLGDLVAIRLVRNIDVDPPVARLVARIDTSYFSQPVPGYSPITGSRDRGRPVLSATGEGTFGFFGMPGQSFDVMANSLYEILMTVSSDVVDPADNPTIRLRLNSENFERGATFEAGASGSASHVPTAAGRLYRSLFVPPAPAGGETAQRFFPSLDLLAFGNGVEENASIRLENFEVRPISRDRIRIVRELLAHDFAEGPGEWRFANVPGFFNPVRVGLDSGQLSLAPDEDGGFGFWNIFTDVPAEPGKIYRARFLVSTNTNDGGAVSPFRLRLNTSNFELASTMQIHPGITESPDPSARMYDVYMMVPATESGENTLLAAIDLIAFGQQVNRDSTVVLERFFLEEVEIID